MRILIVLLTMITFSSQSHAFFGLFESEPNPVIFTGVDSCPKAEKTNFISGNQYRDISARDLCLIKKININENAEYSGVSGNYFYILVSVKKDDKRISKVLTYHTGTFKFVIGGTEKVKEMIKNDIKKTVKTLVVLKAAQGK